HCNLAASAYRCVGVMTYSTPLTATGGTFKSPFMPSILVGAFLSLPAGETNTLPPSTPMNTLPSITVAAFHVLERKSCSQYFLPVRASRQCRKPSSSAAYTNPSATEQVLSVRPKTYSRPSAGLGMISPP